MYIEFEKGQKYANTISDISESHESFNDAGWLLEDNDYVVDIDTLPKDTITVSYTHLTLPTSDLV